MWTAFKRYASSIVCFVVALLLSACGTVCTAEGCSEKTIGISEYCSTHTCLAQDCTAFTEEGTGYCNVHTCRDLTCSQPRTKGSHYCQEHACIADGCSEKAQNETPYCRAHGCRKYGCPEPPIADSTCCKNHTCTVVGCTLEAMDNSTYCVEHNCVQKYCSNPRLTNHKCCEVHLCLYENCQEDRKIGSSYCEVHHNEVYSSAAAEAFSTLHSEYDKVDNITWFFPESFPTYINERSYLLPYLSSGGNHSSSLPKYVYLRLKFVHVGYPIDFDSATVYVDGETTDFTFDYSELAQKSTSSPPWERADINLYTSKYFPLLYSIAFSNETIVRLRNSYTLSQYDFTVTDADKASILDVLTAYDTLNYQLYQRY